LKNEGYRADSNFGTIYFAAGDSFAGTRPTKKTKWFKVHVHRPPAVTFNETSEEFHISTGLCQKIQIKFTARGLWT